MLPLYSGWRFFTKWPRADLKVHFIHHKTWTAWNLLARRCCMISCVSEKNYWFSRFFLSVIDGDVKCYDISCFFKTCYLPRICHCFFVNYLTVIMRFYGSLYVLQKLTLENAWKMRDLRIMGISWWFGHSQFTQLNNPMMQFSLIFVCSDAPFCAKTVHYLYE